MSSGGSASGGTGQNQANSAQSGPAKLSTTERANKSKFSFSGRHGLGVEVDVDGGKLQIIDSHDLPPDNGMT